MPSSERSSGQVGQSVLYCCSNKLKSMESVMPSLLMSVGNAERFSVTFALVITCLPEQLVTIHRYVFPLSAKPGLVMVKVGVLVPLYVALSVMMAEFSLHWYCKGPVPVAQTVKETVFVPIQVGREETGCDVINGPTHKHGGGIAFLFCSLPFVTVSFVLFVN